MHIFYSPHVEKNQHFTLNEEESKHCIKVLRLKEGDEIRLIDGKGNLFETVISDANPRRCSIKINKVIKDYNSRNFYLHIAIAPTKNQDRFEWFLEKTTEMGIDEITPLICSRSERKDIKIERSEKVIIAAMKQSIIAKKPIINSPVPFKSFIYNFINNNIEKYIAHCDTGQKYGFNELYKKGKGAVVLIGPEGDFDPDEIKIALENLYKPVTLGKNRLRTETAGITACAIINFLNE